ncbi:MAG: nicotinate (nicotinamide) nucleotide adenylyltransferase [Treponema sp.]
MKIAMFGGSFNPIHLGHIKLAQDVLAEYDKVIFVPTFISPFKLHDLSNFEVSPIDRLNMVNLVVKQEPRFEVLPFEVFRQEPSFTIDTVKHICNEKLKSKEKLGLIIGSDSLLSIKRWKNYEELARLCNFIVAKRGDKKIKYTRVPYKLLPNPIMPISSTMIRKRIKKGEEWKSLVHKEVASYIEENGCYTLPFEKIEDLIKDISLYAKAHLSEKRFLHSIRVAEMAEHLACSYSNLLLFPLIAYLAGIAHDITKEETNAWQEATITEAGETIDDIEKANLKLVHGKTSAIILQKQFGIKNKSILDAIRYHTFSHPNLDYLGKILYIADKIETGRDGVEDIRKLIGIVSIDEIMCMLLKRGEKLLQEKGLTPHPFAISLLEKLGNKF